MDGTALTRRHVIGLGVAALVARAVPVAGALAQSPLPADPDGTLQAFADTILPGRAVKVTESGAAIHPQAIAGVDTVPGAVEADALALFHHPLIGFDALEGPFLTDLNARALQHGGEFVGMGFDDRVKVCVDGLAFSNPSRILWEAAAAVPFTAFCAAGVVPEQTAAKASGYRVMGLPGKAPRGYRGFSYRKKLSKERTKKGSLG